MHDGLSTSADAQALLKRLEQYVQCLASLAEEHAVESVSEPFADWQSLADRAQFFMSHEYVQNTSQSFPGRPVSLPGHRQASSALRGSWQAVTALDGASPGALRRYAPCRQIG